MAVTRAAHSKTPRVGIDDEIEVAPAYGSRHPAGRATSLQRSRHFARIQDDA